MNCESLPIAVSVKRVANIDRAPLDFLLRLFDDKIRFLLSKR